jgi:UDP-N-acetylglucosamine 4,6-dehydratase
MFANLSNGTVLVTGATGSIGSALIRKLVECAGKVIVFSRDEYKQHELKQELGYLGVQFIIGDVRSFEALNKAFQGVNYCFHTAAMKHVSICEENPFEAVKTNILGTENLINAAIANKVYKVVAISTDKAVHPTSVLGCTKLVMERLLKSRSTYSTKFSSIRFGNILNSRGSVIPLWKEQAANGAPVTVTDPKATRYFIEIGNAVASCLEVLRVMQGGETFVVDCGESKNIYDMAKEISDYKVFTGLGLGEKLHEELFTSSEQKYKVKVSDTLWSV